MLHSFASSLIEGRLRRHPEGGAGSGVLRRATCNRLPREARDPARQALRPGCEELAARIRKATARRCRTAGAEGDGSAAPRPKTATVERREASVPRHGTQGASQAPGVPRYVHAQRVPLHPNVSRRSAHPSIRVGEAKVQTPGAKNAPRERDGLFDIVRWELPKTVRRRAADSVRPEPPHPEERACASDAANRVARVRVSKDEDGRGGACPHASRRIAAHLGCGSTCARGALRCSLY